MLRVDTVPHDARDVVHEIGGIDGLGQIAVEHTVTRVGGGGEGAENDQLHAVELAPRPDLSCER